MNPIFIAEVSSNHHGDLKRCLEFIDKAADIGCGAVKFQLFTVDSLFSPEVLKVKPEVLKRRQWELPVSFLPHLNERCKARGLLFSCTPFYLEAVEELLPYVDFYKVASYELLWDDLLRVCAGTRKPLVLSTGMATMDEIRHAVEVVKACGGKGVGEYGGMGVGVGTTPPHSRTPTLPNPLTLLHCVSGYPTPVDQCNLSAIDTIRKAFSSHSHTPTLPYLHALSVGWSDHSVQPDVILRAVERWGATMIEFHLDLDGEGDEYKTGHCWLPEQIAPVIAACKSHLPPHAPILPYSHTVFPMDGDGIKEPVPSELPDRDWRADPSDGLRPLKHLREELKS